MNNKLYFSLSIDYLIIYELLNLSTMLHILINVLLCILSVYIMCTYTYICICMHEEESEEMKECSKEK